MKHVNVMLQCFNRVLCYIKREGKSTSSKCRLSGRKNHSKQVKKKIMKEVLGNEEVGASDSTHTHLSPHTKPQKPTLPQGSNALETQAASKALFLKRRSGDSQY